MALVVSCPFFLSTDICRRGSIVPDAGPDVLCPADILELTFCFV